MTESLLVAVGSPNSWQSVIRHHDRYVVGTPSGEGEVDQFLALLSWVAPRRQGLGDLTLSDEVSEAVRAQNQAVA